MSTITFRLDGGSTLVLPAECPWSTAHFDHVQARSAEDHQRALRQHAERVAEAGREVEKLWAKRTRGGR